MILEPKVAFLIMQFIFSLQEYCVEKHGGDTRVNAVKVIHYLKDVIFQVTTKKLISPKKGYSGIVGTSARQEPVAEKQQMQQGTGDSSGQGVEGEEDGDDAWNTDDIVEEGNDDGPLMAYEVADHQERADLEAQDLLRSQAPRHTWIPDTAAEEHLLAPLRITHPEPALDMQRQSKKGSGFESASSNRPNKKNKDHVPASINSVADKTSGK